MMKTDLTQPGAVLTSLIGGLLVVILATPAALAGGNNDPIGDLPKNDADGGGDGSVQVGSDAPVPGLPIDTLMPDEPVFVDGDDAVEQPLESAVAVVTAGDVMFQATGSPGAPLATKIDTQGWGQVGLLPPLDAVWSQAVLVLDSTDATLQEIVSGVAPIDGMQLAGLPAAFDVGQFAQLVDAKLTGSDHATWIVLSLDASGVVHHAAVRASANGGPVELLID